MISQRHIPYYREVFELPGFFSEPTLVFGFQDVTVRPSYYADPKTLRWVERLRQKRKLLRRRWAAFRGKGHPDQSIPIEFQVRDIAQLLERRGVKDVQLLDFWDERATLRYDMNHPVPESEHGRYATLIDIGCLEHVFDTRTCLENCLRMLRPGGIYFLSTPVKGYYEHGLHVFNPEGLRKSLTLNGFEVLYERYSDRYGTPVPDPKQGKEVLIWIAGRKLEDFKSFVCPQQGHTLARDKS